LQALDAVTSGTVECAHTPTYFYVGKEPTLGFGTGVPFGLNARQQHSWWYFGGGEKLVNDALAKFKATSIPCGNSGCQMGGFFRKEIKSLADLKGLKMRIGGFGGKVLERIGGVPQNIPGGEIYQALEKGTIDAAEWVGPYDDEKLGLGKVAPNYAYPGWWEGGPELDFFINDKAWNSLSSEYKAAVEASASHAHVDMQAKYDARNPAALKRMVASGIKLFRFPKEMMDAAFKEAMALYSELSTSNPNWKKIYEDFATFRRDENLWFRFTEAGFDDFMQAQRL
ncbi:MAG: TRAP transporter substrate-binding protein DctP, partial [Comamonadaceae bacterium]|nr:TRAP transporter substrate-binding protein DctP [Comamonadaceae bacterium]